MLKGRQAERLTSALANSFNLNSLARMLEFQLGKRLDLCVPTSDSFLSTCFELVRVSGMEGWTDALVLGAQRANPGNAELAELAYGFRLSSIAPGSGNLEAIVRADAGFQDPALFLSALAEIENRVCRISYATSRGVASGTGSLIASDLILTNYHVVEEIVSGRVESDMVECRFDYRKLADGSVWPGIAYRLASDWLVSYDPSSGSELDGLDYAIIRLGEPAGALPLNGSVGGSRRGWLRVPSRAAPVVSLEEILLVLQHPRGAVQKLTLGKVLKCAVAEARIRHDASTLPGSSGSPCFSVALELVAIHRAGDGQDLPAYNEAIAVAAIMAHATASGCVFGER